jgi:hypothetical protein
MDEIRVVNSPQRGTVRISAGGPLVEYHIRGGIAWPQLIEMAGRKQMRGGAVVAGVEVQTDRVQVWEAAVFNAVDPVFDEATGAPLNQPLIPLLLRWWARYYLRTYYAHGPGETAGYYRKLLARGLPEPRLRVLPVDWSDAGTAEHVLWVAANERRLRMPEDVYADIRAGEQSPEAFRPLKVALLAALVGMHRQRWQTLPDEAGGNWLDK